MPETEEQTQQQSQQEPQQTAQAQNAEFPDVEPGSTQVQPANLDILLDINMPISVVIGKTEISFKELIQTGPGAVLQLDKPIGQPAELYVQDIKFATGDIVVVDGCFAVRIKDVLGMDETQAAAAADQAQKEK